MANFPLDVTRGPYINFKAFEVSYLGHNLTSAYKLKKGSLLWECNLYAPGGFNDTVRTRWDSENVSLLGKVSSGLGSRLPNLKRMIETSMGHVVAPNEILLFHSSEPISISLSFKLLPKNSAEAQQVNEIVAKFKSFNTPKLKGGMFKIPPLWTITVVTQTGDISSRNLVRYDYMALNTVSVTYSEGSDSLLYFENGLPVGINLSLEFTCVFPAFRRDSESAQGTPER